MITNWHDRKIGAGEEWRGEIDKHLDTAHIILLLISPDFISSDYCWDIEVKQAMERHRAGEARVIPVILRPVDWSGAPFSELQALPKDARPITKWQNRDEAFKNIAQGVRSVAETLLQREESRLQDAPPTESVSKPTVNALSQPSIFTKPNKVCNALASHGLHSQQWTYDGLSYYCSTPYLNIGVEGPSGLANNLAFYAESEVANTIQVVKLVLNINNKAAKPVAMHEFIKATLALFQELSLPIPEKLVPSIHKEQSNTFEEDYGTVELELQSSRIDTWRMIIRNTNSMS